MKRKPILGVDATAVNPVRRGKLVRRNPSKSQKRVVAGRGWVA